MKTLSTIVRAVIWVIFPLMAFAQSGPQQARPDPTEATASVPPLHYESAMNTYRPMDEKVAPTKEWRSANDTVRDTGSMSGMNMGDESGEIPGMDMSSGDHTKRGKETP